MNPVDVTSSTYTDPDLESNDKDPKFKVCDYARYRNRKCFLQRLLFKLVRRFSLKS